MYDYNISQALGKKRNPIIDGVYSVKEMNSYGTEILDDCIKIHPDGAVYGPYSTIESGEYFVTYCGDNLYDAICDVNSESFDSRNYSYEEISHSDNEIVIRLYVFSPMDDIEFRVFNRTSDDIVIKKILIE